MHDVFYDVFSDVYFAVFAVFQLLPFIEGHVIIEAPIKTRYKYLSFRIHLYS